MSPPSRKTSLYDIHVQAGGRMVEFAGWLMPVWFSGIKAEHPVSPPDVKKCRQNQQVVRIRITWVFYWGLTPIRWG